MLILWLSYFYSEITKSSLLTYKLQLHRDNKVLPGLQQPTATELTA